MKLPKRIRSKDTNNILTMHLGENYVLDLGAGVTCSIYRGDYTGYNESKTQKFIRANPELFIFLKD